MATYISDVGPGRTFADLDAWETYVNANRSLDLVTAGNIEIAEIYGDIGDNGYQANSWTTDASNYLVFRNGPGERYDPETNTGARFTITTNTNSGIYNQEGYTQIIGIGFLDHRPNPSTYALLQMQAGTNALIDGCYIEQANCTNVTPQASLGLINLNAANATVRNTIVYGQGDATNGWNTGITVSASGCTLQNVTICNNHSSGIRLDTDGDSATFTNVISIANATGGTGSDFYDDGVTTTPTVTYCMSSDATADDWGGAGNLINYGPNDSQLSHILTNVASGDFSLVSGCDAENAGSDLSGSFTTDFFGNTHNADSSGWDMGAIDSSVVAAAGQMTLTQDTANAVVNALVDLLDAASPTPGYIEARDAAVLVGTLTLQDPAFGSAANGTATMNGTPSDASADSGGTPDTWIFFDGNDVEIFRTDDSDIPGAAVLAGQAVTLTSYSVTWPTIGPS